MESVVAKVSGPVTATGNSAEFERPFNMKGAHIFVDVTAVSGTAPTMTVQLQAKDPNSNNWIDVNGAVTASITNNGLRLLSVNPGEALVANQVVPRVMPRFWRLRWVLGGTTPSFTFSATVQYLP
jgi:hypothetical protein